MGRYAEARDLDQDTLTRSRRVLGDDHPNTLSCATTLALDLYEPGGGAGRPRPEPRHPRPLRRVLGDDHPSTLSSANSLAVELRALGEVQAARDLDQTPSPAGAGSWATTTPAPWTPPTTSPSTCARWGDG